MPSLTDTQFDYAATAEEILRALRNERDRQIVARRYGLGMDKRHTLEKIGSEFGITRERVRQIEKAATTKLRQSEAAEIRAIDGIFSRHLEERGHVALLHDVAKAIGATSPAQRTYITFLATLAPSVDVIEENDNFHPTLVLQPHFDRQKVSLVADHMVTHLKSVKKPTHINDLHKAMPVELSKQTTRNIAVACKLLAEMEDHWGLNHWPEVNPRSIRDKTYLVLMRHRKPLHFSEIADRISGLGTRKRNVTVQAVHNELIKDPRFVLVGRGIYALSEWGYTPGTVADIIAEVLKDESPLHKDEIVKRVLKKRHVKTTTIVLNLQEKDQFQRVAKATYALK